MKSSGYAEPNEFGGNGEDDMNESFKSEETRGVRFQKEGTEVNKEYVEGFSNLPKLSRTPNTTLTGIPGEFDEPGGEGESY